MRGVWQFFDDPVELIELRLRYFPRLFRWRGQRHEVERAARGGKYRPLLGRVAAWLAAAGGTTLFPGAVQRRHF